MGNPDDEDCPFSLNWDANLCAGFDLATAPVEDGFRIPVGDVPSLEDEFEGGLPGNTIESGSHIRVARVAGVLSVDDGGHLLEGFDDLVPVGDAVMEPAGDVLA